jgi:hypothetical protein
MAEVNTKYGVLPYNIAPPTSATNRWWNSWLLMVGVVLSFRSRRTLSNTQGLAFRVVSQLAREPLTGRSGSQSPTSPKLDDLGLLNYMIRSIIKNRASAKASVIKGLS